MNTVHALKYVSAVSTFFAAENGKYRYWYRHVTATKPGVLKIQIKRADMEAFRASPAGQNVGRFVDIFEVGGGWFEVHSVDMTEWNRQFGTQTDGLKMWLRELNRANVGTVNANVPRVAVVQVPYLTQVHQVQQAHAAYQVDPAKLAALASKFHGVRR